MNSGPVVPMVRWRRRWMMLHIVVFLLGTSIIAVHSFYTNFCTVQTQQCCIVVLWVWSLTTIVVMENVAYTLLSAFSETEFPKTAYSFYHIITGFPFSEAVVCQGAHKRSVACCSRYLHCNYTGPFDVCVANCLVCCLLTMFLHGVCLTFGHCQVTEDHLRQHYAELKEKPFFPKLVKYMSSGPVVPMVC